MNQDKIIIRVVHGIYHEDKYVCIQFEYLSEVVSTELDGELFTDLLNNKDKYLLLSYRNEDIEYPISNILDWLKLRNYCTDTRLI